MTYPHRPGGAALARPVTQPQTTQWTARRSPMPKQPAPVSAPLRRIEAMALMPNGDVADIVQRVPSHPVFEGAFAALARGTIIATEHGPVAIEDLVPGVKVETRDAGYQEVTWIGTMPIGPNAPLAHMPPRLFRIPVDALGPSRPMPDLMLAPHARLLHRSPKMREMLQTDSALTNICAFEDGFSVVRVAPASTVNVYHLAFAEHQILRANGVEIESFHPGVTLGQQLSGESLRLFLSLFPQVESQADFGPLIAPRLSAEQYESLLG